MSVDRPAPEPSHGTASAYFAAMVRDYDSLIRRAVPRYAEMTRRLVDYLPPRASSVLELGCGTGNLTVALARRYPDAALTVVDASPELVEIACARVPRARKVVARFEELSLDAGAFDLATSCIALHHVRDKGALYARIRTALEPGGTFRFADQFAGGTPRNHDENWARWLAFCRRPGHCTEAEIESLLDHAAAHDHYTPLGEHFALLHGAGFSHPDCVWRNWMWGVVTAER